MKPKQLSFDKSPAFKDHAARTQHGGGLRAGKRKLARPFDRAKPLHITMRSKNARGSWSFLKTKNEKNIQKIVFTYAKKFDVKVYRFANGGNHLHLLLKARSRKALARFLKTVCGLIARKITAARKGHASGKFWDELAYSKIVSWGRQFKYTANYVFRNTLEAYGLLPPRKDARGHLKLDYEECFQDLFAASDQQPC